MAGDWIKMRKCLPNTAEIRGLMSRFDRDKYHAVGVTHALWSIADDVAESSGLMPNWTPKQLDADLGIPGAAEALAAVGWLVITPQGLVVPDFMDHNGQSAKERAQASKRQKLSRSKRDICHGQTVTREEKRREEKSTKTKDSATPSLPSRESKAIEIPEGLKTPAFRNAWARWAQHRKEIRKPLTHTSAQACLGKMEKLGEPAAIAMIDHTIAMGWQGLREPDAGGARGSSAPGQAASSDADALVARLKARKGQEVDW